MLAWPLGAPAVAGARSDWKWIRLAPPCQSRNRANAGPDLRPDAAALEHDGSSCPGLTRASTPWLSVKQERRGWPGHRRAEATPSFGRLCPAMTKRGHVPLAFKEP